MIAMRQILGFGVPGHAQLRATAPAPARVCGQVHLMSATITFQQTALK